MHCGARPGRLGGDVKKGGQLERISGVEKYYSWGSDEAIQERFGIGRTGETLAEVWFGAHHLSPSVLLPESATCATTTNPTNPTDPATTPNDLDPLTLEDWVSADPSGTLGPLATERFGAKLPFLMKLIAPKRPLSLQVHPDLSRARMMYQTEELAGIPLDAPDRMYKDPNHKPELIYALTKFEALAGFRAPRRIVEIFSDLDTELSAQIVQMLRADLSPTGIRSVVDRLLSPATAPAPSQVEAIVAAMTRRLHAGLSPSVRLDRIVISLAKHYSGDAGAIVAAMLNPVTLRPGEVLFTPPGGIHAYLSGLGVEVMASSDNVLRAGLTEKHVDPAELLNCLDYVAAPPVRIAPEWVTESTQVFYAPVDDFELSVTRLEGPELSIPGHGGRIVLCIEGEVFLRDGQTPSLRLVPGEAVFVRSDKLPVFAAGRGIVMQTNIP